MKVVVRVLGRAKAELREAADGYEARSSGGAVVFLAAVEVAFTQIADHPERYPVNAGWSARGEEEAPPPPTYPPQSSTTQPRRLASRASRGSGATTTGRPTSSNIGRSLMLSV